MTDLPAIRRVAPNVLSGEGFAGNGVAMLGLEGEIMAEDVEDKAGSFDRFAGLNVPSFPGGRALRAPLLTLAMTWYALRDRLGV